MIRMLILVPTAEISLNSEACFNHSDLHNLYITQLDTTKCLDNVFVRSTDDVSEISLNKRKFTFESLCIFFVFQYMHSTYIFQKKSIANVVTKDITTFWFKNELKSNNLQLILKMCNNYHIQELKILTEHSIIEKL